MAKDDKLNYVAHANLLQTMGPALRQDFTAQRPDTSMISKEDLKAFKLMCSTKQDGRILEAAVVSQPFEQHADEEALWKALAQCP